MLAVKHPSKNVWIMFSCVPCTEDMPGELGGFVDTHDDAIRIWAPKGTPKDQYKKLYDETMNAHRVVSQKLKAVK